MRWHLLLTLLALASVRCEEAPQRKSKSVTTVLSAKWEATPYVLELAEYLAQENGDLFWSFVDKVNSLKPQIDELETDKEKYDISMAVASSLLAPAQLSLARLALSLHSASPAVRALAQMAADNDAPCHTYVALAGRFLCDDDVLKDVLRNAADYDANEYRLETYSVDHSFPASDNRSLTAILYGELGTAEFARKHQILAAHAGRGAVHYLVRWNVRPRGKGKLRLSGYGVELQLKSTEYKSQDDSRPTEGEEGAAGGEPAEPEDEHDPNNIVEGFNFGKLKNVFPGLRAPLERFRRHLSEAGEELRPLKPWQMQGLSMQAAAAVSDAHRAGGDEALAVLTSIAHNFPMQTSSLMMVGVSPGLREEVLHNQEVLAEALGLRPAEPLLLVSGAQHDADDPDILSLMAALREDIGPVETLHSLGIPNKLINKLLSLDLGESGSGEEYAVDIRHSPVTWLNDLESDDRYRRWPSSYSELLRPMYPGMLRNLRRNIYNYIVVVDPTSRLSSPPLQLAETLLRHSTPVRVGVLLATPPQRERRALAAAVRCAFNYVAQHLNSNREAFYMLNQLLSDSEVEPVTLDSVRRIVRKFAGSAVDTEDVLGEDSEYNFGGQLAQEFVERIGTNKLPEVLINGAPVSDESGAALSSAAVLEEVLVSTLARHTGRLQRAVFRGLLSDADSAVDYLMQQPHVMPRLNQRILTLEPSQFIDVSGVASPPDLFTEEKVHKLLSLSGRDALATALPLLRYFERPTSGGKSHKTTTTVWVVGDLEQRQTRQLLANALQFMKETGGVRVAFIPNTEGSPAGEGAVLNRVVVAALATLPSASAGTYVARLLADEGCHERKDCDILPELVSALNKYEWVVKASLVLCVRALGLRAPGQAAVVYNGRLLGPLPHNETFNNEDFNLLEKFSNQAYGDKITAALSDKKLTNDILDDLDEEYSSPTELSADALLRVTCALAARPARTRLTLPSALRTQHSLLTLEPVATDKAAIEIVAILDPASPAAQRLAPVLLVLRKVINCRVLLYLNPADKNSDMPLTSFYRYVLEPELQFTASGAATSGAYARFTRLPHAPLLSLELRTPPNWLIECTKSVYDLDNIRLADVESVVHSEFELESLLVEGHAWDATLGVPPRGLQLTLGTRRAPALRDTIVMANLGYFQLKASPGAWLLRLRPGRSADLYDIVGHENTDTPAGSADIQVVVNSLRSHVIKLRVSKKPGKANVDLLSDDEEASTGIWNSIASSFGGGDDAEGKEETINVFSVASGHLYERFLRIMMLSVLKHTKSPVKFWFLKNYLSPSLMDLLPYMSKEYGFEYELVQYVWPRWLHRQRDRQRTIWGYKILFLDVLFPLHVKKIIFVDADQIVRADLKELVELDLGGAPYGYTPFCDSRTEMEGFRFWKQGYWKNHLQGRRYHISALYVVDLKRFRRVAAGDRLRGQYQALSQDPNSLSNLDQDLPNNMIHQVAIKSLPQEWLWCETWCDDASKKTAKTIDLCNNPMTKEAKLSAAMRIVPEWREYDEEVRRLAARVRSGRLTHTDTDQEPEVTLHVAESEQTVPQKDAHSAHTEL